MHMNMGYGFYAQQKQVMKMAPPMDESRMEDGAVVAALFIFSGRTTTSQGNEQGEHDGDRIRPVADA